MSDSFPPSTSQSTDYKRTEYWRSTGTISTEMYRLLVSSFAAEHARLAFVIGYHTGLRRGAILSLKWDWVDWKESVIKIPPPTRQTNKNKPR